MKDYDQKALKKLNLFFLLNPVPFNGQDYEKQMGPGTSNQLLFRKIPILVTHYLTKFDNISPFQSEAHICVPFSWYVILRHYLPTTMVYPFPA